MSSRLRGYRIAVIASLLALLVLLGFISNNLRTQLGQLAIAEEDNVQWSIAELNSELVNLDATLSEQLGRQSIDQDALRLRIDLALSRVSIVNRGQTSVLLQRSNEALAVIQQINGLAAELTVHADQPQPLTFGDITILQQLVSTIRPLTRELALLGVRLDAERSEQRRDGFAGQLVLAGGITIAIVLAMAALLLVLERMLARAMRRDDELRASTKRLESTVAASLDAIITSDEDGNIIEYNDAAERVFGWLRDEVLAKKMETTIIPHAYREAHKAGMERFLSTRKPQVVNAGRIELSALRKSGEEFPVELNITHVEEESGTKFIAYLRDISERKIDEQNLIDARDRAERTDQAKSQFLAVMSHEMRTPLNGVLGVLDLLKTTPLNQSQAHYVKIASASGEILLEHMNEALDITRIETGALVMTPHTFKLHDLINGLVETLKPLASEKGLEFSFEFDKVLNRSYQADSGRIRQILTNLIGNAIKFTDVGSIDVNVTGIHGPSETSLNIAVTDTGVGIAADNYEKVFEAFASLASPEGRQSRGDGLGLYISRRIARQMGGDIQIKGEVDKGTKFTLIVPLLRAAGVSEHAAEDSEPPQTSLRRRPRNNQKILIVEDNAVNRSVLRDMLQGMGHQIFEASNGSEALESAEKTLFDLIIMDISMPIMDGIEATKRLRSGAGQNANTIVVGLTAHGREEYKERAKQAGMNTFYTKPIRLPTLRRVIDGEIEAFAFHVSGDILDNASIAELVAAIGGAKSLEASKRFFDELDLFVTNHASTPGKPDTDEWSAAVHKLRGAAAMLGMTGLEASLAELKQRNTNAEGADIDLSAIANLGKKTRELFEVRVGDAQMTGKSV